MHLASNRLLLIFSNGEFASCGSYDNLRHEKTTNCDARKTLANDPYLDPYGHFSTELPDAAASYVSSIEENSVYLFFKGE